MKHFLKHFCKIYFLLQRIIIVHFSLWENLLFYQFNCSDSLEISVSSQNRSRLWLSYYFLLKGFLKIFKFSLQVSTLWWKLWRPTPISLSEEAHINISMFPGIRVKHANDLCRKIITSRHSGVRGVFINSIKITFSLLFWTFSPLFGFSPSEVPYLKLT